MRMTVDLTNKFDEAQTQLSNRIHRTPRYFWLSSFQHLPGELLPDVHARMDAFRK